MTGAPHIDGRWWGSTGASVAAHAILLVLLMLLAARASNISDPRSVGPTSLIFVPEAGSGGGGGGGGDTFARPPRPVLLTRTPPVSLETPSQPQPVQRPPSVPALTTNAVETLPGALIVASIGTVVGEGDGPGGGGGRGPGSGSGDGPGLGDRELAGLGGNVYLPGNGVSNPVLIHEVKPNYTADALRAKVQGTVEMEAVVLADGTLDPRTIRITRSLDSTFGLDREAVQAVKRWRFSPATRKGQAVAVLVTLELSFTLR